MSTPSNSDDTITVIPRLKFKAGGLDAALPALNTLIDKMSKEPAFVECYLHRDLDDPDVLVIYETWRTTRDSFGAEEMTRPYRGDYQAAIGDSVESLELMWLTTPFRHDAATKE